MIGLIRRRRAAAIGMALALAMQWRPAMAGIPGTQPSLETCIRVTAAGRPWLEKTLWGLFDQERGWVGAEVANRNGTYDLGPLQVNSSWVSTISARLGKDPHEVHRWLRDDACFSIGVAAWIFLSGYSRSRDFWQAVGAYHSPTPFRSRRYATAVASKLRRRFGLRVFSAATTESPDAKISGWRRSSAAVDMRSARP